MLDAHAAMRRLPLHVYLTLLFSGLLLATGALLAGLGYAGSRAIALAASESQFAGLARETGARFALALAPGARAVDLLAEHPKLAAPGAPVRFGALRLLAAAVEGQAFEAVYIGDPDGSFFLLRPLRDAALRTHFAAPGSAAYLIDTIDAGSASAQRIFLDVGLAQIGRRAREVEPYDPRSRSWYREAQQAGSRRIVTAPYRFFSTGEAGVTVARRSVDGSVVALDVALDDLGRVLAEAMPLPGARAALFDGTRHVLATSAGMPAATGDGAALPSLAALADPALASLQPAVAGGIATRIDDAAGRNWQRMVVPVPTAREVLSLGMAIPQDELLAPARAVRDRTLAATLAVMLLALPLTYWLSRRVSRSLKTLGALADDVRAFRFDGASAGRSPVREVDQLAQAMDRMRETIRRFLDLAASLAAERRFAVLLERVASETRSTVGADAAAIYLLSADGAMLHGASQVGANGSGANGSAASVALAPIALDAASPIAQALRSGCRAVAPAGAGGDALAPLGAPASATLVALPLVNRAGEGLGVLALAIGGAEAPSPAQLAFAEALSSTAAIAIETQRLFEQRKALLDAFIRLLAGAIDAKSPYTGGHCQRVPELTLMLARAACDATDGPFVDYALDDEQWEALQIASWLHDCGKVTTPEYVVDKATKLETLYDRIHEVRMRFEVLKRDAEIRCWRRIAEGAARAGCEAERDAELATLDDEFRFVAACNEGGESMDAARIERLQAIARRSWLRTLDDRIGISHDELQRKQRTDAQALPVAEPLLADKPEHRIERAAGAALPGDTGQPFNMPVPALHYNRGELLNLAIRHGTLTEEERYVINHHIVQTIQMLSQLPLPVHLRAVPDLAGAHHEKMDGSGYPRGLTREQMSPAARMMAIADVFEALTACDRPYKRGKTLSESLAIMRGMCERRHLDGELFELFVSSGVCRRYARKYLRAEQIDLPDGAEAGGGTTGAGAA